ncbi:MAG: hypothetical protein M3R62_05690, partial [Acidobacteriota bacterium]|nr:hypothetical protein [Acidobacteriota bacterium]
GYDRLRSLSVELDRAAQHANDRAAHSRSWSYRNDRDFTRGVSRFAQRAHLFAVRLASYQTSPWQVDDDLAGLLAEAGAVEDRLSQARRVDTHTVDDWKRTVARLQDMIEVYRSDVRNNRYDRRDDRRPDRDDRRPDRDDRNRDGRVDGPAYRDDRGREGGENSLARLVSDVSERANRLSERARQLAGAFPVDQRQRNAWQAIQKLAQDASALGAQIDRDGQPRDLGATIARLNTEAADADRLMRQGNVFPELKGDWAGLTQALQRLRQAVGA